MKILKNLDDFKTDNIFFKNIDNIFFDNIEGIYYFPGNSYYSNEIDKLNLKIKNENLYKYLSDISNIKEVHCYILILHYLKINYERLNYPMQQKIRELIKFIDDNIDSFKSRKKKRISTYLKKYVMFFMNKEHIDETYKKGFNHCNINDEDFFYGQLNQDAIILDFFYNIKKNINDLIFVDVGAYCGENGGISNTIKIAKKGAKGILIEPLDIRMGYIKHAFKGCDVYYEKCICLNKDDNEKKFFIKADTSLNLVSEDGILKEDIDKNVENSEIDSFINCTTVNSLMKKNNLDKINFLSIDVEGAELLVLEGIDFNKYSPDIICIEYNIDNLKKKIINYLNKFNYIIYHDNNQDIFLVKKEYHSTYNFFDDMELKI